MPICVCKNIDVIKRRPVPKWAQTFDLRGHQLLDTKCQMPQILHAWLFHFGHQHLPFGKSNTHFLTETGDIHTAICILQQALWCIVLRDPVNAASISLFGKN